MNKYDIAHGIRTLAVGLLVVGLIPLTFMFTGPIDTGAASKYLLGLLVLISVAVVSQASVMRFRGLRSTSDSKKSAERVYSVIGLSVIGLFFAAMGALWWIGRN